MCCCRSACVAGLFLVWQGVPQTLGAICECDDAGRRQSGSGAGPVASQEVIKLLSGDGGGFFNANSAHPFENPTALTGFVEMLLIFLIGVALTNTFGRMVGDQRHGWALFAAMAVMFAVGLVVVLRQRGTPNAGAVRRSGSIRRQATCRPAATWKARRSASASPIRAVRHRDDSAPPTARSIRCTTATRRSAAWCRCPT